MKLVQQRDVPSSPADARRSIHEQRYSIAPLLPAAGKAATRMLGATAFAFLTAVSLPVAAQICIFPFCQSDTTPPTVAITSPESGATVSGTIIVEATASDNVGVVGIQFKYNGINFDAEDTTAPYSATGDTTTVSDGSYTLTAVARDRAGNRTTSAPVTVTVSNNPTPATTPTPFTGTPIPVPGSFEAEDFDRGGESIAYHDNVPGNAGGQYRLDEDVDIIVSADSAGGGYVVNNFETGEWLVYTVNVQTSTQYDIELRVSSAFSNSAFHVEIDGVNVTGSIVVPNTGSWSNFQWVGKQGISLVAGQHVLKVVADQQYFNLNSIRVAATLTPTSTPFTDTPIPVPGSFEAEDFDRGGESIAYHDNVPGNAGGEYRLDEDVDIIVSADSAGGGYVVRNFETGEWLAYTINVQTAALYDIELRASSEFSNSAFHIEIDGQNVTGTVIVPNTGSWDTFQWVGKKTISLAVGQHVLKIVVDQQYFDLNAVRITTTPVSTPYTGTPIPVPGSFEAEDFDLGGEGVAYHDNVRGNSGGQYRTSEDVDIIASSDSLGGGYVIWNFETGEWLAYTIDVSQTAVYRIDVRASNDGFAPSFHIEIDGVNVTGSVSVLDTGGWSVFRDVGKGGIALSQGQHVLRLVTDQQYFNVNWIKITKEADSPAGVGQWSDPVSLPIVPIHLHLLPDGAVLGWGNPETPPLDGKANERVWDPTLAQPVFQEVPNPFVDVYCGGHSFLADGRLLVTGGHMHQPFAGSDATTLFDFRTRTWSAGPAMSAARWYPTNTTLSNGEVLAVSGAIDSESNVNTLPEVWNTANGWRPLNEAQLDLPLYPWMHLAPDGKIFNSGPGQTTRYLDTSGAGAWTTVGLTNFGDRHRYEGTSVMYEPGKVLIVGGGTPATASAEIIDLNEASPQWRYTGSMTYPRRYSNATLLPDGKVLVTGGSSSSEFSDPGGAVYSAEMWDPATGSWSTLAAMSVRRLYHSTAVLLPDGRVLTAGGGGDGMGGDTDHYDSEYYSPPYLFKGPRPTIASAPGSVGYGETFTVGTPDAASITKATLLGLSSTTHEFNQNQRFVPLQFAPTADGTGVSVTVPSNPNIAPPGYYMLFILNNAGVPSFATMVRIAAP